MPSCATCQCEEIYERIGSLLSWRGHKSALEPHLDRLRQIQNKLGRDEEVPYRDLVWLDNLEVRILNAPADL